MIRSIKLFLLLLVFGGSICADPAKGITTIAPHEKKMKILMVVWAFPVLSETFVVNQIIGLLDRGHDVTIYSLSAKNNKATVVNNDIRIYNLLARTYYKELPPDLAKYDAIVCQFGTVGKEMLDRIKRKSESRPKIATFFRGSDISSYLAKNPGAYNALFREGDLFLTDCQFFKDRLLSLGVNPARIDINYSSIQCSRFKYSVPMLGSNGITEVVTVSRLVEKKGIEDALKAMQKVMQRYPKVHYTIIGDGRLKGNLQRLARKLGIANRVTFAGAKTPVEIAQYLSKSHIFVLPCIVAPNSDVDAIPTVLKEAMSCGLPVVSTYAGGIPELIEDGVTGYLVQQHDVKALSEKISLLVEHPEYWEPFGIEGRKVIEQTFDIVRNTLELERILKEKLLH